MKINPIDWDAYRLIEQEAYTPSMAAKELCIPTRELKLRLSNFKKIHPELFPIESEQENIERYFSGKDHVSVVAYNDYMDDLVVRKF